MTVNPLAPLDRGVNSARRRLVAQSVLNRLAIVWAVALGLGLLWILVEPFLFASVAENQKWYVIGVLFAAGTLAVLIQSFRTAPSKNSAALELDSRFALCERVSTALSLDDTLRATPAGQAVLTDAVAKVAPLSVREKFPVSPRWHSALAPTFAGLIALAVIFATPDRMRQLIAGEGTTGKGLEPLTPVANEAKKPQSPFSKIKPRNELDRANKSEKLKDLETELEKMGEKFDRDRDAADPNKSREKVTELTKMEDKLKQFGEEKFQKLAQLDKRMQELERLQKDPDFADGPAKELNDALSKGDLKKAKEEIDELKKKAQKGMSAEEKQKLEKQLDKMKSQAEQLSKEKEKQDKLKDMIKKAKEQGKDAESLERELDKLKAESAGADKEMQELAEKIQKAQQALKQGDMEDLADQLEKMGSQIKDLEGELQDLEDVQQYLQKLKGEKKKACAECDGEGDCDADGNPKRKDGAKWTNKGRPGEGERGEEKDDTSWIDEKQKGLFDPRGKKVYGGGVRGPAFTKKSTVELGKQIQEAVQEAPSAVDAQRLPRDARDSVKEYFENLGGNKPKN